MPSVLVESCFVSNPREEELLADKKFQKKLAVAISEAVIQFKEKYEAGL
jgi:N-acetylmuramoyl-L-alanine amidase